MIEPQTRPVPDLAGSDDPSASLSSQRAAIDFVRECADDGLLRYIDSAFASLVHELDSDASACVLIASAIVAQMEGRGHSCLSLKDMVIDPPSLLGWAGTERAALLAYWSCLPPARRLQLALLDGYAGTNFIRKVAQPQQRADFLGVEVGPFGLVLNLSFEVLKAPLESAEVAGHTVVLGVSSSTHVGSPFVSFVFSFYIMNLKQRNPDNSFSGTENTFCIEILL